MKRKKIACFTDFSEHSRRAFLTSLEIAEEHGSKLSVVHILSPVVTPLFTNQTYWVLPPMEQNALVNDIKRRMEDEYGHLIGNSVSYDLVVLNGKISFEILQYLKEENIDLALLGSYGHTVMGLALFGSVVKKVLRKAPCAVMIVRGREKGERRFNRIRREQHSPINFITERRYNSGRRRGMERRKSIPVFA